MLTLAVLLITVPAFSATYFVSTTGSDANTGLTPMDSFRNIQFAVETAAISIDPGDIINIASGTYIEQLDIRSDVTLTGAGAATTIIRAPNSLTFDSLSKRSIVRIDSASVVMSNVTVSGPVADKIDFGILIVGGATLNLTAATVTAIRDPLVNPLPISIRAPRTASAIEVGLSSPSEVGHATIDAVTVNDYKESGILVDGPGSTATIRNSTVTGNGPITSAVVTGILITNDSVATVTGNNVSANGFNGTRSGPEPFTELGGVAILVVGAADGTIVQDNNVHDNDIGIYSFSTGPVSITGNTVTNNSFDGLFLEQGTNTASNNTISGSINGVIVGSFAVNDANSVAIVSDNTISNNEKGVWIPDESATNRVTNVVTVSANIIRNNGTAVIVGSSVAETDNLHTGITQNSIFDNTGLGIDMAFDGVTMNDLGDADAGPNNLQNCPEVIFAGGVNSTSQIQVRLNSTPNTTFRIEFFSNETAVLEGQLFIGSMSATTDGAGNFSGTFQPPGPLIVGQFITTTATSVFTLLSPQGGLSGTTSEFSPPRVVLAPTAASVAVAGRIMTASRQGVFGARVSISGPDGDTRTQIANPFGFYRFDGVEVGRTYVVRVTHKWYGFAPRTVSVSDEIVDLDFVPLVPGKIPLPVKENKVSGMIKQGILGERK
jgi:parallel beta-helix repeat protein